MPFYPKDFAFTNYGVCRLIRNQFSMETDEHLYIMIVKIQTFESIVYLSPEPTA